MSEVTFALRNKSLTVVIPEDAIDMVMRGRFDAHILEHSHVERREQSGVNAVHERPNHVEVETHQGEHFVGRYLISTDGANSVVAHALGLRQGKVMAAALEAERGIPFSGPAFVFGELEQGYLWIFPKARGLSVGAAALHPSRGQLQSTWVAVMSKYGVSLEGAQIRGRPIPITLRTETIVASRCFLVGDSAGPADPFSGEGIRLAITSGRMAAQAILAARPEQYAKLVDKIIRRSHRWGLRLANILYHNPDLCFQAGICNPRAVPALLKLLAGEAS